MGRRSKEVVVGGFGLRRVRGVKTLLTQEVGGLDERRVWVSHLGGVKRFGQTRGVLVTPIW